MEVAEDIKVFLTAQKLNKIKEAIDFFFDIYQEPNSKTRKLRVVTSQGIEYHRACHKIYECKNGQSVKKIPHLLIVEVLIRTLS